MKTLIRIVCILGIAGLMIYGCSPTAPPTNTNSNSNTNTNANDNSGTTGPNAAICNAQNRCCDDDSFCDVAECAATDPDCNACGMEGTCVIGCDNRTVGTLDPDCSNQDICDRTEFCCPDDSNCDVAQCTEADADCGSCAADGSCIIGCTPIDPDCDNEDVCAANEFCCSPDENGPICDIEECPTPDVDCAGCVADGMCVALCQTIDPDCSNAQVCAQAGFCCADDLFCDGAEFCPVPEPADCNQ